MICHIMQSSKLLHSYLNLNISSVAVDELLQEFNYLLGTASVPLVHQTISQHLQQLLVVAAHFPLPRSERHTTKNILKL